MFRSCSKIIIFFGVILIAIGMISYTTLSPMIIRFVIEKRILNLSPGTKFYKSYSDPNKNTTMRVYLFEILNSRDFLLGSKPKLRELGPFSFKVKIQRFNLTFSADGKKLTYYQRYIYHFDRSTSFADLNHPITTINFPLTMILSRIDKVSSSGLFGIIQPMVKNFIKESLKNDGEHLLERRTVGQILVGRQIDFIHRAQSYINLAKTFGLRIGLNLEEIKKIGYFRTTNNSVIGPLTVRTGKRDFGAFFQEYSHYKRNNILLSLFNNNRNFNNTDYSSQNQLERGFLEAYTDRNNRYYEPGQFGKCNERRGTDGTAFNTYRIEEHRSLELNTPFCRPMKLRFWNYSTPTSDDPELVNYVFDNDIFNYANDNWCFCSHTRSQRMNQKVFSKQQLNTRRCDGVYDYSQCQKNAAVYLSFPYFANAPGLASYIDGWDGAGMMKFKNSNHNILKPIRTELERENSNIETRTFEPQFSIHKDLGIPYKVRFQLQFNIKITPSMTNGRRERAMYLPFLWFEQRFDLSDKIKNQIRLLDKGSLILEIFSLLLMALGVSLIFISILIYQKTEKKIDEDLLTNLYQKTKQRVSELIRAPIVIEKTQISGLESKTSNGLNGSDLPLSENSKIDCGLSEGRKFKKFTEIRNKKENGNKYEKLSGNEKKKIIKMDSIHDKMHEPDEVFISVLTPLE